jgi:hypothetical protein
VVLGTNDGQRVGTPMLDLLYCVPRIENNDVRQER